MQTVIASSFAEAEAEAEVEASDWKLQCNAYLIGIAQATAISSMCFSFFPSTQRNSCFSILCQTTFLSDSFFAAVSNLGKAFRASHGVRESLNTNSSKVSTRGPSSHETLPLNTTGSADTGAASTIAKAQAGSNIDENRLVSVLPFIMLLLERARIHPRSQVLTCMNSSIPLYSSFPQKAL